MKNYLEEWMAENFVKIGVPFVFDGIDAKFYIDVAQKEDKYKLFITRPLDDVSEEIINKKVIEGLYAVMDGKKPIYEDDDIKCPICGHSMSIHNKDGFYYAECYACEMRSREYISKCIIKCWVKRIKEIIEERCNNENNSVSLTIMEQVANILGVPMDTWFGVKRKDGETVGTYKLDKHGLKSSIEECDYFALTMLLNGEYEVKR